MAEDLTSVVFLEAWRRRRDVRFCGDSVLPWLLGVASNATRNAQRTVCRHRRLLARLPLLRGGSWPAGISRVDPSASRLPGPALRRLVYKSVSKLVITGAAASGLRIEIAADVHPVVVDPMSIAADDLYRAEGAALGMTDHGFGWCFAGGMLPRAPSCPCDHRNGLTTRELSYGLARAVFACWV